MVEENPTENRPFSNNFFIPIPGVNSAFVVKLFGTGCEGEGATGGDPRETHFPFSNRRGKLTNGPYRERVLIFWKMGIPGFVKIVILFSPF